MQSWSKLGSFLKDNYDAESVFYNPTRLAIRAIHEMNVITLFRCDLTTKAVVVAPPSYENPRDASDHQDAMAMDPILINYVCELFLVQGFW